MKRTARVTALIGALLALSLLVAPAVSAKTYVDKKYGYQIKLAQGWTQTPTQPGETTEVAKFKDDRKREFATLSIFRFTPGGEEATTPEEEEEEEAEPVPRGPQGMPLPDRAWEYLKFRIERTVQMYGVPYEGLSKPRKIKAGKVEGQAYTYDFEHPRRRGFGKSWIAGIFARDREEYLLLFGAPKNQRKKLAKWAYPTIKSFRFPGDRTKDIKEEDVEKKGKAIGDKDEFLGPKKRERIKKDLIGTWRFIDTRHYIIIYNLDAKNQGLAPYLAKHLEWMIENAFTKVFPPEKPLTDCMVVRICKEGDEFRHYSGMGGGVLGYWAAMKDELVVPDLSPSKQADPMTVGVMNHEAFHQYIYYCLHKNNPPVWFNEGFAEFFYCVKRAGKTKMGHEKRHPMRFGTIKSAAGSGGLIPAKDFVRLSHRQYMQQASLCYAQGWAFATWLKLVTRNERYRQIPDIYFRELQKGFGEARGDLPDGVPPGARVPGAGQGVRQKALEAALEGIDMDKLHDEFVRDLKKRM
ncbi:MAG: hypothetical protein ACYTDY_00975 [Planctomycetota bacterium]